MTITQTSLQRGAGNWWSRSATGVKAKLNEIITQVNSLSAGTVSADDYFSTNTQTIASNTTLTTLATTQNITASAGSLTLKLGDCTAESTMFDGGIYVITNAGSTNAFDVDANDDSALVSALQPGETALLVLLDDTSAAGTWEVLVLPSYSSGITLLLRALSCTLKDYGLTTNTVAASGTTETLNLEDGNVHDVTLDNNCTFTFSNPPASGTYGEFRLILRQDGSGSHSVTWPASVDWSAGVAPTISTAASSVDIYDFCTLNGGTTWYGSIYAQGLS